MEKKIDSVIKEMVMEYLDLNFEINDESQYPLVDLTTGGSVAPVQIEESLVLLFEISHELAKLYTLEWCVNIGLDNPLDEWNNVKLDPIHLQPNIILGVDPAVDLGGYTTISNYEIGEIHYDGTVSSGACSTTLTISSENNYTVTTT